MKNNFFVFYAIFNSLQGDSHGVWVQMSVLYFNMTLRIVSELMRLSKGLKDRRMVERKSISMNDTESTIVRTILILSAETENNQLQMTMKRILLFLVALLTVSVSMTATDYFVSTTGNDTNGTTRKSESEGVFRKFWPEMEKMYYISFF